MMDGDDIRVEIEVHIVSQAVYEARYQVEGDGEWHMLGRTTMPSEANNLVELFAVAQRAAGRIVSTSPLELQ